MSQVMVREGRAVGVRLEGGAEVWADVVLSNATPKVTFLDLLEEVRGQRSLEPLVCVCVCVCVCVW